MNANNLTGASALEAREYIGLSIMSVAKITGINRNSLSQFEQEKTLLPSSEKKALVNFYLDRGFDFNLEREIDDVSEHEELKDDVISNIRNKFGDELADSMNLIFSDAKERINRLTEKVYFQTEELQKKNYVSDAYSELETDLYKHFSNDKNGNVKVKFGFFGTEDKYARGGRIISLLALQQIRLLNKKNPDLFPLEKPLLLDGEHSDLNFVFEELARRLDFDAFPELKDHNSSSIFSL